MSFKNYLKENEGNKIMFSDLKKEVQNDISNILKIKFPLFNNIKYFYNNDTISSFIADTPNIYVYLRKEDPKKLFNQFKNRAISNKAVQTYINMINKGIGFDPVLVSGKEFIDGGHRVVAYMKVGKLIPVVDIKEILNYDWNNEINEAGLKD